MPSQTNGVYELILRSTYYDEEIINRFHYVDVDARTGISEQIALAFDLQNTNQLVTLVNDEYTFDTIEVTELGSNNEIFVRNILNGVGSLAGLPVAPHITWTAKLSRTTRDTRNGSKRWSGLTESAMVDTGLTNNTLTAFQAVMDNLLVPLDILGINTDMAIVSRPQGQTQGPWNFSYVGSIQALNRITSQNTRKVYR